MKAWHWTIAGVLALRILVPETAFAFQQSPLPGTAAEPAAPSAAPAPAGNGLKLDLTPSDDPSAPAASGEKSEKGGLLGLFPRKLDFGLELLYAPDGAKDSTGGLTFDTPGGTLMPEAPDDVTIRGSVKKRF
ncbi:MAG: hypothetical protein AB7O70_03715 [Hyphomicrobiales bacterium]